MQLDVRADGNHANDGGSTARPDHAEALLGGGLVADRLKRVVHTAARHLADRAHRILGGGIHDVGRAKLLDDPSEAAYGLYGLLKKYFPDLLPGEDYRDITPEELARTSVFTIDIEAWSGKQKKKPS